MAKAALLKEQTRAISQDFLVGVARLILYADFQKFKRTSSTAFKFLVGVLYQMHLSWGKVHWWLLNIDSYNIGQHWAVTLRTSVMISTISSQHTHLLIRPWVKIYESVAKSYTTDVCVVLRSSQGQQICWWDCESSTYSVYRITSLRTFTHQGKKGHVITRRQHHSKL